MKVPPAATYRSRIANEVASSVAVPKRMAPRLSTLTSRRAFGSVPIVRYFMWVPLQPPGPARTLSTSLDAGERSRSNHPPDGHAPALARGAVPLPVAPFATWACHAAGQADLRTALAR